jgi:23S rRNA (adenine2503-C2)-methyltransferase
MCRDTFSSRPSELTLRPQSASSMASMTSRRATRALLGMTREEMRALVVDELGAPAYRVTQIRDSLFGKRRDETVGSMSLVPRALREAMEASGVVTGRLDVIRRDLARDGTGKLAMRVGENEVVEAVGIPDASCFVPESSAADDEERSEGTFRAIRGWDKNRLSACVSSQVGCAMKCAFCATGRMGFKRNLSASEIVAQVLELEQTYAKRVSQVVFMGMGEPMLNLKQVVRAIRCLNEDVGIGGRHITLSTVGIPGSIRKLAKEKMQITLAVSLHAPDQETREQIVPSAKYYPIDDLLEDSRAYFKETGRRVTFEYTLLAGVNDSPSHAVRLSRLLKRKFGAGSTHVNVIPWNNIDGMDFERPSGNQVHRFCSALEGVTHTIRRTRGLETSAACGQLAGDFERQTLRKSA